MIKKEDVLKNFSKEERDEVIKIYEDMELSYLKNIPMFTNKFCTPNIWMYFIKNFNSKTFKVESEGYFEESDRRILLFNNIYETSYPYILVKIENKSKFSCLTHRDYLGAIMSLGLERQKFGDLRVEDNYAIVPIYEDVADYVITSLNSVGKSPVTCEIVFDTELAKAKFIDEIINVPSLRLDNVVSKLAKVSRTKALELIAENKVLVDYSKVSNKSHELKEEQRLTISGVGKFIVGNILGSTKSGRYKVRIKKYI